MKKSILLILGLMVAAVWGIDAQDQAIFRHYHQAPVLINPASAGFSGEHQLMMNMRNAWTGFPNAPKTYMINYNGPIGRTLGLGASLMSENVASMNRMRFQFNYGFRYQIREVKAGFGFSTEFSSMRLAKSVMNNGVVQSGDFVISESIDGVKVFDATLGLYAVIRENTQVGLSFPNLIVAKLEGGASEAEGSLFKYFIFNIGQKFYFDQNGISLHPSLMISKLSGVPFQMDFNLIGGFAQEQLFGGLSYRAGADGLIGAILGGRVAAFKVFYSYDLALGKIQSHNSGSHELTLIFGFKNLKKEDGSSIYKN